MFKKFLAVALLAYSTLSLAGVLHADVFGEVYDGDNPFPVGKIDFMGSSGAIRSNAFGDLYVGDSSFSFGKISISSANEGVLHMDNFNRIYIGDNPFECTEAQEILNIK